MLLYEFQALMPKRVFSQEAQIHGNPQMEQLPFETVQNQYLALWRQLFGQGAKEAEHDLLFQAVEKVACATFSRCS